MLGQVAAWSTVTVDTIAETKKVVFRPSTAADTIIVGHVVFYNSDISANWREETTARASGDLNGGGVTAFAEGNQTYNGRLLIVEQATTTNMHRLAGIVKSLGPEGGADGDTIEIYVANGAIVPVWTNENCVARQTILGAVGGSYIMQGPLYGASGTRGHAFAVAQETVDRSATAGFVWASIDKSLFINQGYGVTDSQHLKVPAETADTLVNRRFIDSLQTGGVFTVHRTRCMLEGNANGGCPNGAVWIDIAQKSTSNTGDIVALKVVGGMRTTAGQTNVLSSGTKAVGILASCSVPGTDNTVTGDMYALWCDIGSAVTLGGIMAQMRFSNTMLHNPDYWFDSPANTGVAFVATAKSGDGDGSIKVRIGGTDYWIQVWDAAA